MARPFSITSAEGWTVVELRADAVAKNGMRFDKRYCWRARFVGPTIAEVRAYLDTAMAERVFAENAVAA
jgi:ketosteroid isomerase-like protein